MSLIFNKDIHLPVAFIVFVGAAFLTHFTHKVRECCLSSSVTCTWCPFYLRMFQTGNAFSFKVFLAHVLYKCFGGKKTSKVDSL